MTEKNCRKSRNVGKYTEDLMGKNMKSWRKTVAGLLAVLLVTMFGFLMWTNISYYNQANETIRRQNANTAELWKSAMEVRLDMLYEHLHELLLTVYNNTELKSGSPMMEYSAKRACLDVISDKLRVSDDAECFFLKDTESEIRLFGANSSVTNLGKTELKNYFYNSDFEVDAGLANQDWTVERIGGRLYFVKIISLGKYIVGTASSLSRYDLLENYTLSGSNPGVYLAFDNQLYRLSGDEDATSLSFGEDGTLIQEPGSIVTRIDFSKCGVTLYIAVHPMFFWSGGSGTLLLGIASAFCLLMFLLLMWVIQYMIVQPTEVILEATNRLGGEDADYRIEEKATSQEFARLFGSFNNMADNLRKMRIEAYDRKLQEKSDELKMLRAQLRPHFYLNAITTVSNMTYQDRDEDIRRYLAALAKYVRYMLNMQSKWVSVSEEIEQIRSYLEMQKIKFPGSVDAYIGYADEVAEVKVPYLLLFTAVENSFKHAMSLYDALWLVVQCEHYEEGSFRGLRMTVQDNGKGFSEEVLELFSPGRAEELPSPKDHLGLTNISRTLRLLYHRNDLLRLSNAKTGGAHVEIWIPEEPV